MDPERFARVLAIFDRAAPLDDAARDALLSEECAGDVSLQSEVRAMLASDARANPPITVAGGRELLAGAIRSTAELTPAFQDRSAAQAFGGRYHLIRILGEGGMGTVYEAEQLAPRRRVALKAIRRSGATPELLRRFEHEAHVLGRLHHPGIAQIFEAGVAESENGLPPYFAMELIDGPPITDFADQRALTVRQRVELIIRVCDAVQHAHQRGVIHRDLKPSNILVAEGQADVGETLARGGSSVSRRVLELPPEIQPKVLDFGVARAAPDAHVTTMHTISGQLVGTLAYMSPEQITADPEEIDTRADIYALGVILYQMLTGRIPHDLTGLPLHEAVRIIREEAPPAPRTGDRDLDTIILRAMSVDRERRYPSAVALAADLTRFLTGEPIDARRDSALYVMRKQVARYRGAFLVAGLLVLLLAILAGVSAYYSSENFRLANAEKDARHVADAQSAELRESLYLSQIGYAQAALLSNDVNRAVALLDSCPPDLRGWEWRYLMRLRDRSDFTIPCDGGRSGEAQLSDDGRRLAVLDANRKLVVFDLASRTPIASYLARFAGDGDGDLAMTTDGELIACSHEKGIVLLSGSGLSERGMIELETAARDFAFLPDNRHLIAISRDSLVRIFDVNSGDRTLEFDAENALLTQIAIAPGSAMMATLDARGRVQVWDCATGHSITEFPSEPRSFCTLAFSPDGSRLAIAIGGVDIRVCDPRTGETLSRWETKETAISSLSFDSDGTHLLVAGSERLLHVWNISSGAVERTLRGHRNTIAYATFSKDGKAIVSVDSTLGLKYWSYPPADDVATFRFSISNTSSFAASADGGTVVAAAADYLCSLSLSDGAQFTMIGPERLGLWGIAMTPGGGAAYTTAFDRYLRISGVRSRHTTELAVLPDRGTAVAVTADGALVAASAANGEILLLESELASVVKTVPAHGGPVMALAFSNDGTRLLSGGMDGWARLWTIPDGRKLWEHKMENGGIGCVAFALDDRHFVIGGEDLVTIWDAASHSQTAQCTGHRGMVNGCSYHPDGARLATAGSDRAVRLWDARTGREILALYGHDTVLRYVLFSGDGRRLVSTDRDGVVRIWEAPEISEFTSLELN